MIRADYDTIRMSLGADDEPPRFVLRRRNLILGLCVRADQHPRIYANPAELWVEGVESALAWGDRLAEDAGALRLFVCPGPGLRYRDRGWFRVLGSTHDPLELAMRMAHPGVDQLARVIFLEPV